MTIISKEEVNEMLEELGKEHSPEKVEDTFGGEFIDGIYQSRLDKIYFDKIKEQIKLVIHFEMIAGNYKGRTVWKWINMETEQNLDFATRDMRRLGLPHNFTWKELPNYFSDLLDNHYEIELKTKNDFQNVYIRKEIKIEDSSLNKKPPIEPDMPDDDIPY